MRMREMVCMDWRRRGRNEEWVYDMLWVGVDVGVKIYVWIDGHYTRRFGGCINL